MRVVVIGAGLGGLSAACHLVGAGHEVVVLEREAIPGGRAGRWDVDGYGIDTGPSVLTMPELLRHTLAAAGADLDELVTLRPLDPLYRATWPGQEPIYVRAGREAMTEEIRAQAGSADAAAFGRFADWLEALYRVELPSFIDRNQDSPLTLVRPLGPALRLARLGAFRKVASVVGSRFQDPRLRQLFSFQSLYAGLSPFDALAVYCVITYMDVVAGVWFPEGGIHAVAEAMATAVGKAGGTLRYGAEVERILRRPGARGAVHGVRLTGGERIEADAVVCNVDLPVAYRRLLPDLAPPHSWTKPDYSPSCLLWLAGTRGPAPTGAAHHNIHFGGDWRGSFDALIKRGELQPDPAIMVSLPALSDPGLAPPGGQVIYALEPTPHLRGRVDWDEQRRARRDRLVGQLSAYGYPVSDVVAQRLYDPTDWEAMGMEAGTPFALSHRFFQSGPFRPPNVDRHAPGLVFTGSGTVPGVSVPMVLISGRLAADRVSALSPP